MTAIQLRQKAITPRRPQGAVESPYPSCLIGISRKVLKSDPSIGRYKTPEHPVSAGMGELAARVSPGCPGGIRHGRFRPGSDTADDARWMPVAIIGLVAITAGIALPRALPSAPEQVKAVAAPETPAKILWPIRLPPCPSADPESMLTRLGLATAGVFALCVGSLWFGRRWLGGPSPTGSREPDAARGNTLAGKPLLSSFGSRGQSARVNHCRAVGPGHCGPACRLI